MGEEGGFGEGVLERHAPYMGVGCRVKVFFWGFLFHALMFNFRVSDNFLDTFYNNPDLAPILTNERGSLILNKSAINYLPRCSF